MSQYAGYATDGCTTAACQTALAAPTSLSQGDMFAKMTSTFHGGRRSRRRSMNRKGRKASRKGRKASRRLATRKSSRRVSRRRAQRGGAGADYPNEFSVTLPADMHAAARIGSLDAAFAQLPEFVGKYGNQTGGGRRRTARRAARRAQRGGVAPVEAPAMILSPQEEPAAFLNPQWYTENQVIPSFQGPANPYAAQQQPQFAYAQKAGRRRASRKASRKMNRKHRK
jgi:hypothetical protein